MNIGTYSGWVWALFGALFAFGVAFNAAITWMQKRDWSEGYVWVFVVVGVVVTILPSGFFIGWSNVTLIFAAFCFSGLPMALGDIYRHVTQRNSRLAELRKLSDDQAS